MTVYDMSGNPATWQPGVMKMTYFGCPWHGVLKNGELYANDFTTHKKSLPNWTQVASARVNSATQLVRVPGMPAISRTSEQQTWDTAQGFDWKNYALVGGYHLYGKALHSNWIIYIDGNNVPWMLDMYLSAGTAGFFCKVYLRRIFGRISETSYPVINSELANYTDTTLEKKYGTIYQYSGPVSIERNSTGSVVFINVYAYDTAVSLAAAFDKGFIDYGQDAYDSNKPKHAELLGVYKVELSGNGSTVPGTLGDGISATVTQYKNYADCYSTGSEVVAQNEYVVLGDLESNGQPYGWSTQYDQDQRVEQAPCPTEYVDTATHTPIVYSPTYSDATATTKTRLLRVLFDNDTAVEYSAKHLQWLHETKTSDLSGQITDETTYTVAEDEGGYCVITNPSNPDVVSTGSMTRIYESYSTNHQKFSLMRNGAEVASADYAEISHYKRQDVNAPGSYTETVLIDTTTYECNGHSLPHTYNYRMTIHPYSPQIYGVQLRDNSQSPAPAYCTIMGVMVPWGADTTHEKTDLSHDGFNCVGSHEPLEQKVYWYESGVTDVANAKINFI